MTTVHSCFIFYVLRLFSAAVCDHAAESRVEVSCSCELIDSQVHAVTPVVTWVCRHVDALGVWIVAAESSVH